MALALTADIAYSFRKLRPILSVTDPNPTTAMLARIEQLIVDAGTAYRQRRYNDAVAAYTDARNLLWGQLFPLQTFDEGRAANLSLTRSLVSYAAEWMNVLPVEQATVGVRPRELVALDAEPVYGLLSANTGTTGTAALADLALADELDDLGNAASATVFRNRAVAADPNLVKAVQASQAAGTPSEGQTPANPTPATPTTPAAPAHPVPAAPGGLTPVAPIHAATGLTPSVLLAGGTLTAGSNLGRLQELGVLTRADIGVAPVRPPVVTVPPALTVDKRTYTVPVGSASVEVEWTTGNAPSVDDLLSKVYQSRVALAILPDVLIRPQHPADVAVSLAHAWYYETPLGLAECYHALGDYVSAEKWYLTAAKYQYLNAAAEAPYVWARTAQMYLDWGDSLFRDDDPTSALPIYERVLTADFAAPTGDLYTIAGLAPAVDQAKDVIANLADPSKITATPAISSVIFGVQSQLAKINGGLDFWGHWAANVPIWTFDYLQSVAVNFCQLAVSTERDAINFWQQADAGTLTRLQLTQNVTLSAAEQAAAQSQVQASAAEANAYSAALSAAQLRASDARANATEYAAKSANWSMHQALSSQLSGGEDGDASELNQLADRMIQGGYSLSGDRGTLAAAESLTAARLQNSYEIDTMNRQAAELDAAATQAKAELTAANARTAAAQAAANAAAVRTAAAQQLVSAFDDQRFTPDVWNAMGERMSQLSQRYLGYALDVAKRMQRAYNFENDTTLAVIRSDYSSDAVNGLLAADSLMADIQSFTYDLVTSTAPKAQPVKQTISLANRYPFLFETGLRATGTMQFDTDFDDFDSVYPGTYAGRIEHVEVAVDGIVPATGISGTLTNAGISHYRVPAALASTGAVKHRVQAAETLVISDYDPRTDTLLTDTDARQRRIFQGAGLASAWTLDLPKAVNGLDYASITDVRLTFSYQARFDPDLKAGVLTDLASRPGANTRLRPFPLRWLFPDAFFTFYTSGVLTFSLDRNDFGLNEAAPTLTSLSAVVVTTPAARAAGMLATVTAAGSAPVSATTAADGTIAVADLAAATTGQSAIGDYRIELAAADNPDWVTAGALDLDPIANIALVVGYSFTPRS